MVEYDSKIIQEHATGLYAQIKSIVIYRFFVGIFSGFLGGVFVDSVFVGTFDMLIPCVGVLIGIFLGYGAGKQRVFELKLQAQTALCQMQIEKNTRK
ncbi:MAG: hypothetical protein KAJ18_07765 [Candidatus Omnitrophica bacterium]|nr:hypothetical protein [Candidatus Omnitrophota bacterium]